MTMLEKKIQFFGKHWTCRGFPCVYVPLAGGIVSLSSILWISILKQQSQRLRCLWIHNYNCAKEVIVLQIPAELSAPLGTRKSASLGGSHLEPGGPLRQNLLWSLWTPQYSGHVAASHISAGQVPDESGSRGARQPAAGPPPTAHYPDPSRGLCLHPPGVPEAVAAPPGDPQEGRLPVAKERQKWVLFRFINWSVLQSIISSAIVYSTQSQDWLWFPLFTHMLFTHLNAVSTLFY